MEGFFAACGLPDILERSPRGERPYGSKTSSLPDRGAGANLAESPERHPPSLPEHPRDGASRTACQTRWPPAPSGQKSLRNGQAAGQLPCFLPRRPLPGAPTLPSLPVALNTALCTDSVPPCGVPCRQPNQSVCPTGSASSSQEGPSHTFRAIPAAGSKREREREKENTPPLFTPQHPPSSPAVWHALFQTAARQRRGLSPRPEESFFGDGESTRGEGAVFTKNAPSPLVIPPLHSLSTTKKAGQSPAPAFTGKTKER